MNLKQRILTYIYIAAFLTTLFFVPWRVQDSLGGNPKLGYEISPYWHPVIYDEGGALKPVLLDLEWKLLAISYAAFYIYLRTRKTHRL